MSLLLFANEPINLSSSKDFDNCSFAMDDFESTMFKKNDNDEKLRQRTQILLDRNMLLTVSNCQKLDVIIFPISTSNNDVNVVNCIQHETSLKFINDLISVTDGQTCLDTTTFQQQSSVTSFKISFELRLELLCGLDNMFDLTTIKRMR